MQTVADLMTRDVLTLHPEDDLSLAETILALGGIRHLPVTEGGSKLVGIVTQRDLLRACSNLSPYAKRGMVAEQVMKRQPITVRSFTPLRQAFALILKHKIGCLPVVEEGDRLIGILTETDVVRFALDQVEPRSAVLPVPREIRPP